MSKALIQYQGERSAAANAAFWINILLGIVVALTLVLLSGTLAHRIFHDPRVGIVLKVMSLQVLLSALAAVHSAILQKQMRFKRLFWIRLATVGVPSLVSIPLAFKGYGYWALIAGTLTGQSLQVAILWATSGWKPKLGQVDWKVGGRLFRFGAWVGFTGLLFWFYNWADSLIVGIYLGSHGLGLFRTGNMFVTLIFGTLFAPLIPVLYSHFSGMQEDRARIRAQLLRVMKIVAFLSVPMGLLICANAPFMAQVVFGQKWVGVEKVVAIMALVHGMSWIISTDGEAYRAMGAPAYETKIALATLGIYGVGYVLSIRHGLDTFLWTRLGLAVIGTLVHLWFARKALGFPVLQLLGYISRILLASAPVIFLFLVMPAPRTIVQSIGWAVTSSILILGGLWLLERNKLIPELRSRILSAIR